MIYLSVSIPPGKKSFQIYLLDNEEVIWAWEFYIPEPEILAKYANGSLVMKLTAWPDDLVWKQNVIISPEIFARVYRTVYLKGSPEFLSASKFAA